MINTQIMIRCMSLKINLNAADYISVWNISTDSVWNKSIVSLNDANTGRTLILRKIIKNSYFLKPNICKLTVT